MPTHIRHQIRDRTASTVAGLSTTGTRVYKGRTRALAADHAPSWLIYTRRETSDVDSQGDTKLVRGLTLMIEGRANASGASAAEDVEDLLDLMSAEAEVAMVADPSLGGIAIEVTLQSTDIEVIAPGDLHEGRIVLQYRVVYRTREADPTAAV